MRSGAAKLPRVGASVAVFRDEKLLLIQRQNAPYAGAWSLPGGAIQWGEPVDTAARRELFEETGLRVGPLCLADAITAINGKRPDENAFHYVVVVFAAKWVEGDAIAGGDALGLDWFDDWARSKLILTPGLPPAIAAAARALKR